MPFALYKSNNKSWSSCFIPKYYYLYEFSKLIGQVVLIHVNQPTDITCSLKLLLMEAKKQSTISRSGVEAKYRSMVVAASKLTWITSLLHDIGLPLSSTPLFFCDSLTALFFQQIQFFMCKRTLYRKRSQMEL